MRLAQGLCIAGTILMLISLPSITSLLGLNLALSILTPLCWTGVTFATTGGLLGIYSLYARPQERIMPPEEAQQPSASPFI
ncbi:MAG: hypothetical protein CK424_04750 [Legionella sp.]|nr:MAG: hypothetical protein CK424_04750 [Legionella sp.]